MKIDFKPDVFFWNKPPGHRKFTWAGDTLTLPPGTELRRYRVDEGLALFKSFAELPSREAAILDFANTHGPLTANLAFCPLSFWRDHIRLMRQMVDLRYALKEFDWKGIRENLQPFHTFDTPNARAIKEKLRKGNRLTDEELIEAAVMRLLYPATQAERNLIPEVVFDAAKKTVGLRLRHASLLDYMWHQLSRAVVENVELKSCQVCGSSFDPRRYRDDHRICSDRCRYRLYQDRIASAKEMRAKGKTPRQIAKELSAELTHVKKWIAT